MIKHCLPGPEISEQFNPGPICKGDVGEIDPEPLALGDDFFAKPTGFIDPRAANLTFKSQGDGTVVGVIAGDS